jgi:AcrR family transcriptional regulator
MTTKTETANRIADAALRALARRGVRRLSMTDIGAEARVSRGTLYRYFTSREDVLAAAEARILTSLAETLTQSVFERPDEPSRLRVVLDALASHHDAHPVLRELTRAQPALATDFYRRNFSALMTLIATALDPAPNRPGPVAGGALTHEQLAEAVLRLALTADLLPTTGSAWSGPGAADLWEVLLTPQDTRKSARRPARRGILRQAS